MDSLTNKLDIVKRLGPSRGENAKDWTVVIPRALENGALTDEPSRRPLNGLSFALSSFSCWSLPYNIEHSIYSPNK
jgi:hypothetical protein